jgi:ligand-binding sensor domain-containing protein
MAHGVFPYFCFESQRMIRVKKIMTVLTFLLLATVKSIAFPMINGSDINEKLSHSSVWTILQDSRGMMWFGTKDGLNCYNGYDNIIYGKS